MAEISVHTKTVNDENRSCLWGDSVPQNRLPLALTPHLPPQYASMLALTFPALGSGSTTRIGGTPPECPFKLSERSLVRWGASRKTCNAWFDASCSALAQTTRYIWWSAGTSLHNTSVKMT